MLAETPVTQRSTCYSAVSASLTNPLPNCSNYLPFCHAHCLILRINTALVSRDRPFTKPLRRRLILHCCSAYLEVMYSEEYHSALETEQQAEAGGDVPPPPSLQIVISTPFCLFLFSLYPLCSLSPSLFPHFP